MRRGDDDAAHGGSSIQSAAGGPPAPISTFSSLDVISEGSLDTPMRTSCGDLESRSLNTQSGTRSAKYKRWPARFSVSLSGSIARRSSKLTTPIVDSAVIVAEGAITTMSTGARQTRVAVEQASETISATVTPALKLASGSAVSAASTMRSSVVEPIGGAMIDVKDELYAAFKIWGQPTRGGIDASFRESNTPLDANFWERTRDSWLRFLLRLQKTLLIIAIILTTGLFAAAAFIVVLFCALNFGADYGDFSADVEPACNLSLYNQSEVLFRGSASYPPRTTRPGVTGRRGEEIGMGGYVALHCTLTQRWFNVCIKYFSFYFTYSACLQHACPQHAPRRSHAPTNPAERSCLRSSLVAAWYRLAVNGLPLPWTISVFNHAHFPNHRIRAKRLRTGVDFYGRPTRSLWFNLPLRQQKIVSGLTFFALLVQIPDAISHVIFWSYLSVQTWPGIFITNIWLGLQITCQIVASVLLCASLAAPPLPPVSSIGSKPIVDPER